MERLRPEELLQETRWLRRLALRLADDRELADDAVQDTLLQALRRLPRLDDARAWLSAVLRHRVLRLGRREAARPARERGASGTSGAGGGGDAHAAAPSAAELAAVAELHRDVAAAVVALPEPYRSAIVLRFLHELPPAELAAKLGVPVETARTRVKRGLALLRERLDARYGDRRAWTAALPPAALASVAAPALVMGMKLLLGFAGAAAAVAAFVFVLRADAPADAPDGASPIAASPPVGTALSGDVSTGASAERAGADPIVPGEQKVEAIVRGVVLDEVTRLPLAAEVSWGPLLPEAPPERPTVTTDAAGRFALATSVESPHRAYELLVRAPGLALVRQSLGEPLRADARPREYDVGTILVPPGTGVAGIVVDAAGQPVAGADLLLFTNWFWSQEGRIVQPVQAFIAGRSEADGTFVLRDRLIPVQGPPLLLAVHEHGLGFVPLPDAARERRELAGVRVALEPTAVLRVAVRDRDGAPFAGAKVVAEPRTPPLGRDVDWLSHVDRVPALLRALAAVTDAAGRAELRALPAAEPLPSFPMRMAYEAAPPAVRAPAARPVPFTLRVVAAGCEPFVQRIAVDPKSPLDVAVTLQPPTKHTVRGTVRDPDGRPIEGADVRVFWGETVRARTGADGTFVAGGLPRRDSPIGVQAKAKGWTTATANCTPKPGETEVSVALVLRRARTITGKVVDQHQAPIAGAQVWLEDGNAQSIASDARGEFAFADVADDGPKILAVEPPLRSAFAGSRQVEIGASANDVTVVLERLPHGNGSLRAILRDAGGEPLEPKTVQLERLADENAMWHPCTGRIGEATAADLSPGRWRLAVEPVRGHALAAEFDVADGHVELQLAQRAPGTVRGTIELAPGAEPTDVRLFPPRAPARFVPGPGQQLTTGGGGLKLRAEPGATFALVDADPSRLLAIEASGGSLCGEVVVQPLSGGEVAVTLRLDREANLAFVHENGWPQGSAALLLRRPGSPWPEPSRITGLRGKTSPLVWPVAPGEWEWRIDGLPGGGGERAPTASGRVAVAPGATAEVRLRLER